MNRIVALLAVLVAVGLASVLPAAAADGPVKTYSQDVTLGFFRGQVISYLDLGPVKLARGNKVAPIWAFTNGHPNQRNVIDTVPGQGTMARKRSTKPGSGGRSAKARFWVPENATLITHSTG